MIEHPPKKFSKDLQSSIQPPKGSNRANWIQLGGKHSNSRPLEKFMRWCMEMQVSNGVLHGVLSGEVPEECCMGCML